MVKVHVKPDCGNAPKMELLRDFTQAFPKNQSDVILDNLADDVRWEMVGERVIEGKEAAKEMVMTMMDDSTEELYINTIITHGDTGAVEGTMKFKDGSEFGFADIYEFTNHSEEAKIKSIRSFIVPLKKD